MYNISYINIIEQFDHTYSTVIIADGMGMHPDIRIDKQYPKMQDLTQEYLINNIINDIYVYNLQIVFELDLTIDYSGILRG